MTAKSIWYLPDKAAVIWTVLSCVRPVLSNQDGTSGATLQHRPSETLSW